MSLDTFFQQFELLSDAPNGVQKLRELILQLAVRGQLVPQDPEDEPASELLKEIEADKRSLLKAGKLKKHKPLPQIKPEELPYELPQGWEWVRLGEIGETNIGLTYAPSDLSDTGIPVLRSNNIQNGKLDLTDLKRVNKEVKENVLVQQGDLLICARNGSKALVGKTALIPELSEEMAFGAFMAIFRSRVNEFLLYFINSPLFRRMIDEVNTMTINQITQSNLRSTICPLPPLAEQKRIVAKVDELMSLCDRLEEQQKERRSACIRINDGAVTQLLNASTPEDFDRHWERICNNFDLFYSLPNNITKLRQAILQLAVQGRLISHDSGVRWKTLPLTNLCAAIQTGPFGSLLHASDYIIGGIPLINPQNIQGDEIRVTPDKTISSATRDRLKNYVLRKHDIVLARRGELGRCAVIGEQEDGWLCGTGSLFIRLIPDMFPRFIKLWLNSPKTREKLQSDSVGSTMNNLNQRIIGSLLISVPPFEEQQRIVEKVDRLMTLCDKLEFQLNQAQGDSEKLMEVAVRQILVA